MTDTPTPRQTAPEAPEGASQPRGGAGRPPGASQSLSGAVEGSATARPTDKIRSPWTPEQVDALNRFQREGGMHPFTCGNEHPAHPNAILEATESGWRCHVLGCDYEQDWAHAFMADPNAWPQPLRDVARAIGDFAEHQAVVPPRLKALAVNAVGPALQARGEWLRLTTRQAVAVAVLVAVKAELEAATRGLPDVAGKCPACLRSGLFLGDGGYVTCPQVDCPDPTAAHDAIEERAGANAYDQAINTPPSAAAAAAIRQRLHDGTTPRRRVDRTTPDNSATSSDGPTVAECAADDRRHWSERQYEGGS
ncbi:hypothetical protein [Streptomyces sp. BA2]|uniref:hypothetical protein n=1 Tax=Streptomyces sp. BA2 TaxID=436595 RepID=UPI0013232253|nr:hypothetical protein [Streptomyces sp. BA2]MWA08808.1 hypothetical protein [Streptomyces sp. BA2]